MSAKHGIAGAVFLVLMTGPMVRAQIPTDLPFVKPTSPTVGSSVSGPTPLPMPPGQGPPTADPFIPGYPVGQPPATGNPLTTINPLGQQPPASPLVEQPGAFFPGQSPSPFTVLPGQELSPGEGFHPDPLAKCNGANCCGPIGGHGPIGTEFWLATGPSFVIGGGSLSNALRTGWEVEGGGRSLFFATDGLSAWSIDASVSYTANGGNLEHPFQGLLGPGDNVTIHYLNRAALHVGLGKDWWWCGSGDVGSDFNPNFRFGVNAGATYGSSHVDLNSPIAPQQFERIQGVYAGAYIGLHWDMEIPLGGWTFLTGIKAYWTDDFLHVLPGDDNILGINLLWNVGFRY